MDSVITYLRDRLESKFGKDETLNLLRILEEDIPNLSEYDKSSVDQIIDRLVSDEPVQYVTEVAPFYGYFYNVSPAVLIPRPETEELVYAIVLYIKEKGLSPKVLDIGSGSGCIPITLDKEVESALITSIDISNEALEVARSNNTKLKAKVKFELINFLDEDSWESLENYDIIVSNPPYIPEKERSLMSSNVLDHEPGLALFVSNEDPLIFYRKIYEYALRYLNEGGAVFLECNEYNATEVVKMYQKSYDCELIKDMQGKERILKAIKKGYSEVTAEKFSFS